MGDTMKFKLSELLDALDYIDYINNKDNCVKLNYCPKSLEIKRNNYRKVKRHLSDEQLLNRCFDYEIR